MAPQAPDWVGKVPRLLPVRSRASKAAAPRRSTGPAIVNGEIAREGGRAPRGIVDEDEAAATASNEAASANLADIGL
jgi:hypothetical protein